MTSFSTNIHIYLAHDHTYNVMCFRIRYAQVLICFCKKTNISLSIDDTTEEVPHWDSNPGHPDGRE